MKRNSIVETPINDLVGVMEALHRYGITQLHLSAIRKAKKGELDDLVASLKALDLVVNSSIDCRVHTSFLPSSYSVIYNNDQIESAVRRKFQWRKHAQANAVYVTNKQKENGGTIGLVVISELVGKKVLPWNVGQWLLDWDRGRAQDDIPEEWKGKRVVFWGTIFFDSNECQHSVMYIEFVGGRFGSGRMRIGERFSENCVAALLAE